MWNVEITNKTDGALSIDIFACYELENVLYMILECDAEKGYFIKKTFPYHIFYEEYEKAMSYDRNEGMLEVAKQYLESGDTVFYAVGLAHLLDSNNGLVDTLQQAGYTVELVQFAS